MFFKKWNKKIKPVETEITKIIKTLNNLNYSGFSSIYSSDKSIYQIHVCCKSIIEYSSVLDKIIIAFNNDNMLYMHNLPTDVHTILIRDFFLDKKGNYLDPEDSITTYSNKCINFLQLYQTYEQKDIKSFNTEKNLLHTQHIINNILISTIDLLSVVDSTI